MNAVMIASFITILLLFVVNVETKDFRGNRKNDDNYDWHNKNHENCEAESSSNCYDYIIVGAGTAGSVVARRLSDDPKNKVLLLEQGYWSSLTTYVQDVSKEGFLLSDPMVEFGYVTIPQTGLKNRTIPQPRAKITGGCNSHNGLRFIIGNRKDYDERWGPIDGWNWTNLSPYWNNITNTYTHTQLNVTNPIVVNLLRSAEELNYTYNPNPNDLDSVQGQGGASLLRVTTRKIPDAYFERETSWNAYVQPILPRENLDILVFTHVHKILFNENLTAIGVKTYNPGNKRYSYYYSRKEIVLSAGVFETPKLLLLSGIGPCNELTNVNITCLSDVRGVGKNLQDHAGIQLYSPPLLDQNTPWPEYYAGESNILAIEKDGEDFHDLQMAEVDGVKNILDNIEIFHFKSRGSVTLRDNDPLSHPIIDINYLSNADDDRKILEAVKFGRRFFTTQAIRSLIENGMNDSYPEYNTPDDAVLLDWIKENTWTDYHPTSTCKMGNDFSNDAIVVDKRLRVRNTKNLRIADGSIMPETISGNTNQITMIIGFKAADMIQEDSSEITNGLSHRLYSLHALSLISISLSCMFFSSIRIFSH